MARKTEPVTGTADIFPEETAEWLFLEETARRIFTAYGYGELRTPVFERTDVFRRSLGDETDVVQKEMYTFEDRGGRSLTLRPEGTAGVMRALANAGIPQGDERRVFYLGPMFRGERPAAGRRRQFHQIGVECVGKTSPYIDVECIQMLCAYLDAIGVGQTRLSVNTRGTADDRQRAGSQLRAYFSDHTDHLCDDCRRRLETNVWRILDCKEEACGKIVAESPSIAEFLSDESRDYFARVCHGLTLLGLDYRVDPRLVRGLDYYEHTVWEMTFDGIGAQNALVGGGRYLVTPPGVSKPLAGVGFGAGLERLILARAECGRCLDGTAATDVFLVSLGDQALDRNLQLAANLRRRGLTVQMDLEGRGMKSQLRNANKVAARLTVILGEDELAKQVAVCKNMADSSQEELPLDDLVQRLVDRLSSDRK